MGDVDEIAKDKGAADGVALTSNVAQAGLPVGGLSGHILPTSATMVGVCLTAQYISLLGPAGTSRVFVDKLLAIDALVFLVSAIASFVSMRSDRGSRRLETRSEAIFLAGLGLLAIIALVLAFTVE